MTEAVDSLEADENCGLMSSVSKMFVEAADGISQIVCERGSSNEPVGQHLEMLPHELDCMYTRQLVKVLQLHSDHMLPVFKAEGIESNSHQFLQLLQAI